MNKGILLVSFGTTYRETREKNIKAIADAIREYYPDYLLLEAYSSDRVRSILKNRDNMLVPGIKEALEQMKAQGVHALTILPTHIIDGVENHKLKEIASAFATAFHPLRIAGALLEAPPDYEAAAKALWDSIKEYAGGRIVIFMGHGTSHASDQSYGEMERALQTYSGRALYIATVEGSMTIEDVIKRMKCEEQRQEDNLRQKAVLLTPFMLVAGEHAVNDMAGEGDSFYTKVINAGYEAECLLKGIGEYEEIRKLYIKHLRKTEEE